MSLSIMSRIKKVSTIVWALILFVAVIHVGSLVVSMALSDTNSLSWQVSIERGNATVLALVRPNNAHLAQTLTAEGFNAMAILDCKMLASLPAFSPKSISLPA